jgi:5-methylcytosine-specific restriction endonuclease McrA
MAREFSKKFYNSPAWKKVRKSFIANRVSIDGGMCQMCHDVPGYIVDHIEELNPENINNTNITLRWHNLQYLCLNCHNKKTFGNKEKENYFFDSNGMIHELPPLEN